MFRVFKMVVSKILTLAALSAIMAISAKADDSGRYTRKAVRPSFFVPDNEFNKQEHLPAFPTIDNGKIKVSSDGQIMIKNENEPVAYKTTATQQNKLKNKKNKEVHLPSFASKLRKQENKSAVNEEIYDDNDEFNENASEQNSDNIINNTPISVKAPVKKTYTAEDGLGNALSSDAAYLAKEKAYEEDLRAMAKTGSMPENSNLNADLQKMDSDISFSVD